MDDSDVGQRRKDFGEQGDEARVGFHGHDTRGCARERQCQMSHAGADFEHDIAGLNAGMADDLFDYVAVMQEILAEGLFEAHTVRGQQFTQACQPVDIVWTGRRGGVHAAGRWRARRAAMRSAASVER